MSEVSLDDVYQDHNFFFFLPLILKNLLIVLSSDDVEGSLISVCSERRETEFLSCLCSALSFECAERPEFAPLSVHGHRKSRWEKERKDVFLYLFELTSCLGFNKKR